MDADIVNAFLAAAKNVIEQVTGKKVTRKGVSLRNETRPAFDVVINFGVIGEVKGKVIYAMSNEASLKLASAMAMGMPFDSLENEIARSAIAELGNMITGNAMTLLADVGKKADISPPSLIIGNKLQILSKDKPALAVELSIEDIGDFDMIVQLDQ